MAHGLVGAPNGEGANEAARDIEQCRIKGMLGTLHCHGGGEGGQCWSTAGLEKREME